MTVLIVRKLAYCVGLIAFSLPVVTNAEAHGVSVQEVSQMGLEDLMSVRVVRSVSKKEESTVQAPGFVSVMTAEELERLGVQTVSEAIKYMSGIVSYDSYFTEYSQFAIRGNFGTEHTNAKILFTVNGHPMYYPIQGGFEVNAIPLDAIEQIEIVRGPASVLYGTNALSGMINIVTKKSLKEAHSNVKILSGSFGTKEVRASVAQNVDQLKIFASTSYHKSNGYLNTVRADQDEAGRGFQNRKIMERQTLFLNISYKSIELDLHYWKQEHNAKIGLLPLSVFNIDYWEHNSVSADLRFREHISESIELIAVVRADTSDFEYHTDNLNLIPTGESLPAGRLPIGTDNFKYGVEVYAHIQMSEGLIITPGILHDRYGAGEYSFEQEIDPDRNLPLSPWYTTPRTRDTAVYMNTSVSLSEKTQLVGGVRYTDNSITEDNLDYRAGIIYQHLPTLTFKALYATSYRSPNYLELFTTSAPILSGNVNLDFEKLRGFDIGVDYLNTSKGIQFSLVYFYNKTEDYIRRIIVNEVPSYRNTGGFSTQGIEFEASYVSLSNIRFFINGTQIVDSEDESAGGKIAGLVDTIVNVGVTYSCYSDNFHSTWSNNYNSDWGAADSYTLSNIALQYDYSFGDIESQFFLTAQNIFDENYEYFELVRRNISTIPGGPGTSIIFGLSGSF